MAVNQQCQNCNETAVYLELMQCGYCGLPCCEFCINLHEQDCDRNPENN